MGDGCRSWTLSCRLSPQQMTLCRWRHFQVGNVTHPTLEADAHPPVTSDPGRDMHPMPCPVAGSVWHPGHTPDTSRAPAAAASGSRCGSDDFRRPMRRDEEWVRAHQALQGFNTRLATACARDPLEHRSVAAAAVRMAAHPCDYGVHPQQAANFLNRMMG